MKNIYYKRQTAGRRQKIHRIILIFLALVLSSIVCIPAFSNDESITISGKITDYHTGMPIVFKEVFLISDTSDYIPPHPINMDTISNKEGNYFFTIATTTNKEIPVIVYVIDCFGEMVFKEITINGNGFSSSHYEANFQICKNTYYSCDPDFTIEAINESQVKYTYRFHDKSGNNIVKWQWDFGDGSFSEDKNPRHSYDNPGIYKVTLTVSNSIYPGMGCTDSLSRFLGVGNMNNNHFGGQVFAGQFPIDLGMSYLYEYEDVSLTLIDSAIIDTLGYYIFYNVTDGDYIVRVCLDEYSEYFNDYNCTYYGDELFWQDADIINIADTGWNYDIDLIPYRAIETGTSSISGRAIFVDTLSHNETIAKDVEIYLSDNENNAISCVYTDNFGKFMFSQLPQGIFSVCAEVPGAKSNPETIMIDQDDMHISDIVVNIITGKSLGIGEESDFVKLEGSVYPNPCLLDAKISLQIKKPTTVSIQIFNQLGQEIISKHLQLNNGTRTIPLNVRYIDKGVYFIRINTTDNFAYTEKLIKM